jgi:Plastocyanin-like domain
LTLFEILYAMPTTYANKYQWEFNHAGSHAVNWVTPRPQYNGVFTQSMSICAGDIVNFSWDTPVAHNIGRASRSYFSSCAGDGFKKLSADLKAHTYSVKFTKAGTYYYLCNVGSHCIIGHKMAVTVKKC